MVLEHSEFHSIPTIISVLHILYVFMLLISDKGNSSQGASLGTEWCQPGGWDGGDKIQLSSYSFCAVILRFFLFHCVAETSLVNS